MIADCESFPRFNDEKDAPRYEWDRSGIYFDPTDRRHPIQILTDTHWMSLAEARGVLADLAEAIRMAEGR